MPTDDFPARPPSHRPASMPLLALACLGLAGSAAEACSVRSGPARAVVVELYTSEGCSSCPPADRWLSSLAGRADVVAQAFHVDYWDVLGWKDRFASPAHTERQRQLHSGARFVYTPQIVVDGIDRAQLPAMPQTASVTLALAREGDAYVARITPAADAPRLLAAYWTLTENGHASAVRAGENAGATLHHDFVVREYRPQPAWRAEPGGVHVLRFVPTGAADAGHARSVNVVVTDAVTGRPLQALRLGGC